MHKFHAVNIYGNMYHLGRLVFSIAMIYHPNWHSFIILSKNINFYQIFLDQSILITVYSVPGFYFLIIDMFLYFTDKNDLNKDKFFIISGSIYREILHIVQLFFLSWSASLKFTTFSNRYFYVICNSTSPQTISIYLHLSFIQLEGKGVYQKNNLVFFKFLFMKIVWSLRQLHI